MTEGDRHGKAVKRLKLAGLAFLGLCTVSIPLTIALVLSATGTSDLLTIGGVAASSHHETPARAVAGLRCVAKKGYYALTFDDGPYASTTPRLVATLRKAKAVATFFDVGERAATRQDLVELQRSVGQVANHSYSHPRMPGVSQARRLQELTTAATVLDHPNAFFRPPFGATSPAVDTDIARSGLTAVYWTVDTQDAGSSADQVTERALTVKPGGIVLLHDGVASALDAIPAVVEGLRRRGMCPGFLATTPRVIVGANGSRFHVTAVKP